MDPQERLRRAGAYVDAACKENVKSNLNLAASELIEIVNAHKVHRDIYGKLIEILIAIGKFEESEKYVWQALTQYSNDPNLTAQQGVILSYLRRFDEALDSIDAACDLGYDPLMIRPNRMYVLNALGRCREVGPISPEEIAINHLTPEASHMGDSKRLRHKYDDALYMYDTVLEISRDICNSERKPAHLLAVIRAQHGLKRLGKTTTFDGEFEHFQFQSLQQEFITQEHLDALIYF